MGLSDIEREVLRSKVIEVLKNVYDPEIPINIYDLGLVYDVNVSIDGNVIIEMTLTAPGCPIARFLVNSVKESILDKIPEVKEIEVNLVFDPPWNPLKITPQGREEFKKIYGYDIVEEWIKMMSSKSNE
ncbi:MAG: iron-sulfur cluster assembly protein [Aigarchaeota archaeon]|nr:iron-sulfur cluster assembly protein [Candidatus Geocrenenecus dongiae]